MPYGWISPEVFLKSKGVTVYHTYRNNDMADGARDYFYSLQENCGEEECGCDSGAERDGCNMVFDVRGLPGYQKMAAHERKEIKKTILAAIGAGILTVSGRVAAGGAQPAAVLERDGQ